MTTPRLRHHLFVNQYQLCSTEKPEADTLLHQVLSPEYKALREIADRLTTGEDILFAATCASASPLAVVPSRCGRCCHSASFRFGFCRESLSMTSMTVGNDSTTLV